MTQPCSTNDHGTASLQGKGQGTSQGLPRGDWAVVLPTQKLLQTNLTSQENFIQIHSPVQKLFMISRRTDGQTNRHTNSIQNESPLYPTLVQAEIFFYPVFSTSHKIHFVRIKFLGKNIKIYIFEDSIFKNVCK